MALIPDRSGITPVTMIIMAVVGVVGIWFLATMFMATIPTTVERTTPGPSTTTSAAPPASRRDPTMR